MQRTMEAVRRHYSEYPEGIEGLDRWRMRSAKLFR
jgi:hypothetical protein